MHLAQRSSYGSCGPCLTWRQVRIRFASAATFISRTAWVWTPAVFDTCEVNMADHFLQEVSAPPQLHRPLLTPDPPDSCGCCISWNRPQFSKGTKMTCCLRHGEASSTSRGLIGATRTSSARTGPWCRRTATTIIGGGC